MPQQTTPSVLNNFSKGFKTEFTGLNFPEDACTETSNCIFSLIGDVLRREGIDKEINGIQTVIASGQFANSSFKWKDAGGDGNTEVLVVQVGGTLYFYKSSASTTAAPLSTTKLASTVDITAFVASGGTYDATLECQYSIGNGYLFVTHPSCDPFYCTYNAGTITSNIIVVQIRDFNGVFENVGDTIRPGSLTVPHTYNLVNQGWSAGAPWTANTTSSGTIIQTGSRSFVLTNQSNTSLVNGNVVQVVIGVPSQPPTFMTGTVTAYASPNLTLNVTSVSGPFVTFPLSIALSNGGSVTLNQLSNGYVTTWHTAIGNYPSNSDVWWTFKNSTNNFDPTGQINNVTVGGPAPKGSFILNAFQQLRGAVSGLATDSTGVAGVADVVTLARPKTNAWFQGRVWYTGVDASFISGQVNVANYTWSENIYFSQIVTNVNQFGRCYQTNDPTSETLFNLLPTDGGVITIPGCGSIYKLFPIQNGVLVFAANGVWFITGSQGIGFSAGDYVVSQISKVQSVSSTSFIDVQGAPYWWNEEGIYTVAPGQSHEGLQYGAARGAAYTSGLDVQNIALGTILSFYANIPRLSKQYARGDYHYVDYIIQWIYRSTNESDVLTRYRYDTVMNYNTVTKAFYTWTIDAGGGGQAPFIHDVKYISYPGAATAPDPDFKYLLSYTSSGNQYSFADQHDTTYVDWSTLNSTNFVSDFTGGYSIKGKAQMKFQSNYIYLYLANVTNASYKFQGIWDYAINILSNKFTSLETINITESTTNFGVVHRRHRVRGRGLTLQFKVTSVAGKPFDVLGWSVEEKVNQGV